MNCTRALLGISALCFIAGSAVAAEPLPGLEIAISGVRLNDPSSAESLLATTSPLERSGSLGYSVSNAAGTEVLTLIQHPGSQRFSISEAIVAPLTPGETVPPLSASPKNFVTGRGVRLGMSRRDVLQALGKPSRESEREFVYSYSLGDGAEWLRSYNMPEYRSIFRFTADKLSSFEFGFPYP